jgi:hypothetical protein
MHHRAQYKARSRVANPKGRRTRTQTRRWGLRYCHPRSARNSPLGLRVASYLTHFVSGSAWSKTTKLRRGELNDPRIPRPITRGYGEKHILRCAPAPPPQRSFRVFHSFLNPSHPRLCTRLIITTCRTDQEFIDAQLMRHYLARARGFSPPPSPSEEGCASEISWRRHSRNSVPRDRFENRYLNWVNDRSEMIYSD